MNDVTRTSKELVDWLAKGLEQAEIYRVVQFPTPSQAKIIALAAEVKRLRATHEPPAAPKGRNCMADMHADPPRDCDAPYCGCNPAWSECMQMLQECGWKSPDELRASQPPGVDPNPNEGPINAQGLVQLSDGVLPAFYNQWKCSQCGRDPRDVKFNGCGYSQSCGRVATPTKGDGQ